MKHLVLLITIVCTAFSVHAQKLTKLRLMCSEVVNSATYKGKLSEKQLAEQYHQIGFKFIEDGKIRFHDELVVYNCNTGEFQFSAEFEKGELTKSFKYFYANGALQKQLKFAPNKKANPHDLVLYLGSNAIKGYPVGKGTIYYPSGKIKTKISFKRGNALAIVRNYNKKGKKINEGKAILSGDLSRDFVFNKEGNWISYENGNKSSITKYSNNTIQSIAKFDNGFKSRNEVYKNGLLSSFETFYSDGQIKARGKYVENQKDGSWIRYDQNGHKEHVQLFESGKLLSEKSYDAEGELKMKKRRLAGDEVSNFSFELPEDVVLFEVERFNASKIKSREYVYNDITIGEQKIFAENGDVEQLSVFNDNGQLIREIDGQLISKIELFKKATAREALTAQTFYPRNAELVESIKQLKDSARISGDSLSWVNDYENYFLSTSDNLLKLSVSNQHRYDLDWFKDKHERSKRFTDKNFEYANKLEKAKVDLEVYLALQRIEKVESTVKADYTYEKETLFGTKVKVKNGRDKLFESFVSEIIPDVRTKVGNAQASETIVYQLNNLETLFHKFQEHFENDSRAIDKALGKISQIEEKKNIILTSTSSLE